MGHIEQVMGRHAPCECLPVTFKMKVRSRGKLKAPNSRTRAECRIKKPADNAAVFIREMMIEFQSKRWRWATAAVLRGLVLGLLGDTPGRAQMPVLGDYYAHDPSRMIKEGNRYYIFRTSQGIMGKYSTDLRNWTYSGQVFPANPPAWTTNAVPGFTGDFWAPDLIYQNGKYYLYYVASQFGTITSGIGLVTSPSLQTPMWSDQGPVIQYQPGISYNCIDPSILQDTNGMLWMSFGSYSDGIFVTQLDPVTGKRITTNSPLTKVADNSPNFFSNTTEASFLYQHGGYYYLFINFGGCCAGIDSTYNIRYGRATSVTGPFRDRQNISLVNGGGTVLLESTARFIGPGQAGIMADNGTNWFTYHYYDGNNGGTATLGLTRLVWSADGWPVLTNDWSAQYSLNVDAREQLGRYNGALSNNPAVVTEPGRGRVLSLNGTNQYAVLPDPVANASTFAAWVNWHGGPAWQRIFDFGTSTNNYFFLTPLAASGKWRFAINTGSGEQTIDAPTALPSNSWVHVAVTLDGLTGRLYLDGVPVATNASLTYRPWQTLARSNYFGKSQFPADPYFNGKLDAFRIFGRALSAPEIQSVAYEHPLLAHRYGFSTNGPTVWDSAGYAHGLLMGNATITNGALVLGSAPGDYVMLPGGLISGCTAVSIEFWATLGVNANWARVFDFGNFTGGSGNQYLFFSPHSGAGTQRLEISTNTTVDLDIPGTLDNRTVCVTCIVDPTNNYCAIYTNGVLAQARTGTLPALASINPAWCFLGHSLFSADPGLNGTIDEFRIYDGRLSPQEIAVDYQYGPDQLALPVTLGASNSPAGITLTWPAYAVGFAPETKSSLLVGTNWTTVTQTATLTNNLWKLNNLNTNNAQFYRLRR